MSFLFLSQVLLQLLLPNQIQVLYLSYGHATAEEMPELFSYDHGAIIRGDTRRKELALIFTGGEFGEGCAPILDALGEFGIQASFFVTGEFVRKPGHAACLRRIITDGHYLGPHSDTHPLYCSWEDRSKTLVTREFFESDLRKNITDLRSFGALPEGQDVYFIPPYEWFNADQVEWALSMDVRFFNFTPGSGSNRDWAPPGHEAYATSHEIITDILKYETSEQYGLNGFLLLLHLGAEREDKVFLHLDRLIKQLAGRGYSFVRVDQLLGR